MPLDHESPTGGRLSVLEIFEEIKNKENIKFKLTLKIKDYTLLNE